MPLEHVPINPHRLDAANWTYKSTTHDQAVGLHPIAASLKMGKSGRMKIVLLLICAVILLASSGCIIPGGRGDGDNRGYSDHGNYSGDPSGDRGGNPGGEHYYDHNGGNGGDNH